MAVDINKLSRGEQVIGASGIVLLVFSFFNWYGGEGFGLNGWQAPSSFLSTIAILIGIAMAGYVIAKLAGAELPTKPGNIGIGLILCITGAVSLLFLVIKYISNTEGPEKFGFYISILASAGLAAGGFLKFQEEKSGSGGMPPRPPGA